MRRSFLYICGIISLTHRLPGPQLHQARHQLGELDEIGKPAQCAAIPDDDLWIRCNHVRPLLRHRANLLPGDAQEKPCPIPVVPLANTHELASAERVEWVRYAHKARVRVRSACSSS